jgi:hypothetical protein
VPTLSKLQTPLHLGNTSSRPLVLGRVGLICETEVHQIPNSCQVGFVGLGTFQSGSVGSVS